ncbi:MAG: Uma2 family endonuclease [Xenococcaceae cyanobacterium]
MYQTDPPLSPKKVLPTMYDLPSEDPEEPGLPDEYHLLQSRLLKDTFCPANYPEDRVFVACDLNLYYDVRHTGWYKRPDWFAVVGVDRLYEQRDLRMSYVVWQEGVNPFVVVELLSPGTEKEDLGQTLREANQPPTKWEVYERILRVPYYIVFDRYIDQLRVFQLTGSRYGELELSESRLWIEDIGLGIGLWQGNYQRAVERQWLRWYDADGNWIPTAEERAEQERRRAEQLAEQLSALGIEPELGDET